MFMKKIRQTKTIDRLAFLCIGMIIAGAVYFTGGNIKADKDFSDTTDGIVVLSILINDINHQIIRKKIDVLYYTIMSENTLKDAENNNDPADLKKSVELFNKAIVAQKNSFELMIAKKTVLTTSDYIKDSYKLLSDLISKYDIVIPEYKLEED